MPDMNDPRMAQMAMMRDRMMRNRNQEQAVGQFQGGLALPEQLPEGPVDPNMMIRRPMPVQAQGIPQRPPMPMGQPMQRPMGIPPQQGTPANMPMANTMNPNANSARPNMMRNRMMQRRGGMGQQAQAGQSSEVGSVAPRSITPF